MRKILFKVMTEFGEHKSLLAVLLSSAVFEMSRGEWERVSLCTVNAMSNTVTCGSKAYKVNY